MSVMTLKEINNEEFNEAAKKHKVLIEVVCRHNMRAGIDIDDLRQESLLALWVALEKFDPTRSENFLRYLSFCISSRLRSFVRSTARPVFIGLHVAADSEFVIRMYRILEKHGVGFDDVEDIIACEGVHPLEKELPYIASSKIQQTKMYLKNNLGLCTSYKDLVERGKLAASLSFNSLDDGSGRDVAYDSIPNLTASLEVSEARELLLGEFPISYWVAIYMSSQGYTLEEIASELEFVGFTLYTKQNIRVMINKSCTFLRGRYRRADLIAGVKD